MADDSIVREIRQLREDIKEDFTQLRDDIKARVLREVYAAEHAEHARRIGQLELDMVQAEEKRVASRRWIIASIALPVLMIIVSIVLAVARP